MKHDVIHHMCAWRTFLWNFLLSMPFMTAAWLSTFVLSKDHNIYMAGWVPDSPWQVSVLLLVVAAPFLESAYVRKQLPEIVNTPKWIVRCVICQLFFAWGFLSLCGFFALEDWRKEQVRIAAPGAYVPRYPHPPD